MERTCKPPGNPVMTGRAVRLPRSRRFRIATAFAFLLGVGLLGWFLSWDRPLKSVSLPDGGRLELWEIAAPNAYARYTVRKEFPSIPWLRKYLKPYLGRWSDELEATHPWASGLVVWLSAWDADGRAAGMDWLSHAVVRDEQGWGHPLRSISLHEVTGTLNRRVVTSQDVRVLNQLGGQFAAEDAHLVSVPTKKQRAASRSIFGLSFPSLAGQNVTLELYDQQGQLTAEFPMVAPYRRRPSRPLPLQGLVRQQHFEKVTVTLEGLDIEPLPKSPVGIQSYRVRPRLTFQDKRPIPADWSFPEEQGFAVFDDFDNHSWSEWSALSPHSETWRVYLIVPNPVDDEDCWSSGPMVIPGPGENKTLSGAGAIRDDEVQLLKLLGAGTVEDLRIELRGRYAEQFSSDRLPGRSLPLPGTPEVSVKLPEYEGATLLLTAGAANGFREHSYVLRTTDGRELKVQEQAEKASGSVRVLRLPAELAPGTEFTLQCIIQQRLGCNFVIPPPPLDAWKPKPALPSSSDQAPPDVKLKRQEEG